MFIENEPEIDDASRRSLLLNLKNTIIRLQGAIHTEKKGAVVQALHESDSGSSFLTQLEKVIFHGSYVTVSAYNTQEGDIWFWRLLKVLVFESNNTLPAVRRAIGDDSAALRLVEV